MFGYFVKFIMISLKTQNLKIIKTNPFLSFKKREILQIEKKNFGTNKIILKIKKNYYISIYRKKH